MLLNLLFVLGFASASEANITKVFFDFREGYDQYWCTVPAQNGLRAPFFPPKEWIDEAKEKLPHFQRIWNQRGAELLKSVVKLTGRKWTRVEDTFFLYLCPNIGNAAPMASFPLWPFLKTPVDQLLNNSEIKSKAEATWLYLLDATKKVNNGNILWSDRMFTDWYMFHEILHYYVWSKISYEQINDVNRLTPGLKMVVNKLAQDKEYLELAAKDINAASYLYFSTLHHIHLTAIRWKLFSKGGLMESAESLKIMVGMETAIGSGYRKSLELVQAMSAAEMDLLIKEMGN